eukprot:498837_1
MPRLDPNETYYVIIEPVIQGGDYNIEVNCTEVVPGMKEPCGLNRWCYYMPVTPNTQYNTDWNVTIQNEEISGDRYFDIFFSIENSPCVNPKLSFIYELIDYDSSYEYIDIFGNDSTLVDRCGAGASPNSCNNFGTCLSQRSLNLIQIDEGSTYQISITESSSVNALCHNQDLWSINAKATLHCSKKDAPHLCWPTNTTHESQNITSEYNPHNLPVNAVWCYDVDVCPKLNKPVQAVIPIKN